MHPVKMTQGNSFLKTHSDSTHQPPIILLAEDDQVIRNNIAQLLENEGYQAIATANGQECLAAYQQTPPNLVLLDAMMPKMDGFECCKQLLTLPGSADIPILMITGLDDETSINWAFASGASDFITKPIRWPVLRQRVRNHLEKHQLYKQLAGANQKLTQLAAIDDLTQLPNFTMFSEGLQKEWQRMAREKSSLSLIVGAIDEFQSYKDTCGHQQGNDCLAQVADVIKQCLKRHTDLATHYDAEKFAILLPCVPLAGAVHVAEEVRRSVKAVAIPYPHSSSSDRITISLGVVSATPSLDWMNTELLFKAVDLALHQAQADRGDQVSAYPAFS